MRTVPTLMRDAIEHCGGQAALAEAMGIERQDVHAMGKGLRQISEATVGLLCDVLEVDGREAQRLEAEAVIASAKVGVRERLRRAFFAPAVIPLLRR